MAENSSKNLTARPPVIVVVGHVDHGKTSLLDYLRKTNVVAREAGGITQSVGGYEVTHNDKKITFIDTPGHEAFSQMRVRGADIADLAILVIAADEGVKPQTVEAIKSLTSTETPFVVAITKIDKPNANVEKVRNELLSQSVFLEGFGGSVSWQPISVKTGEGINELLDLVLLMGDVLGLTYDPRAAAEGYILESLRENRRGIIAYVIIKNGVLHEGDLIATCTASGKVRILENFIGKRAKELQPSSPAAVVGFETLPEAGEEFKAGPGAKEELKNTKTGAPSATINKSADGGIKFNVALKADTSGSLEALQAILSDKFQITAASVGNITDGDVKSALTTESLIVGFRVKAERAAENLAQGQHISIFTSDIIYRLVEELEARMKADEIKVPVAEIMIIRAFGATGKKQIIGGRVTLGVFKPNMAVTIERAGVIAGDGKVINVQMNRVDVVEAPIGTECGLLFESDTVVRAGDKLQVF
jgi:translation initiation factor IF-2